MYTLPTRILHDIQFSGQSSNSPAISIATEPQNPAQIPDLGPETRVAIPPPLAYPPLSQIDIRLAVQNQTNAIHTGLPPPERQIQPIVPGDKRPNQPKLDGLWQECPHCSETRYTREVECNFNAYLKCNYHFRLDARERIVFPSDEGSFEERSVSSRWTLD